MALPSFRFHRYFLDGVPGYLARHYWWAYLWSVAVWFFDHQPIINAILFGQYRKLMLATMSRLRNAPIGRVLQLTCVYGQLTPKLIKAVSPAPLHLADVAMIQLELAKKKAPPENTLLAVRMDAERLAYADDSFSTLVLFFLLHEMPEEARINVLSECMRVIQPGGVLLMTEYAPLPEKHFLYRIPASRWLICRLEPFLDGFWRDDIASMLNLYGNAHGKKAVIESDQRIFSQFYRVTEFRVADIGP